MLKTILLALAATFLSSSALAYDQADRDAPLGILVPEPGQFIMLPGEEHIWDAAPPVCDEPAPSTPTPTYYHHYRRRYESPSPVFISQPAQSASVRLSK